MTWFYSQKTGVIRRDEDIVGIGYSGQGDGKNNPLLQSRHNVGPLPQGRYQIGPPRDTLDHGPLVLPLAPSMDNRMYGRSGFLIHGDSIAQPGQASEGCIILAREYREQIAQSGDNQLEVTE